MQRDIYWIQMGTFLPSLLCPTNMRPNNSFKPKPLRNSG
jgi:hypothetical protein